MDSNSKNILLIGASGGVGSNIAVDLAKAGHRLALHYHSGAEQVQQLADTVAANGGFCKTYKADITNETEVQEMMQQVAVDFESIDVLVNNAGITKSGMSWKMELADWQQTIDINLTGVFLCIKHALPVMRNNNWGRIVNITSVVGQAGFPGTVAYAASKAGLIGLTKTVAKEVAEKNITVNSIALGYFEAGMLYKVPEPIREQIKTTIPQKAFGDTAEISNCILYLCNASYLTGQTINLNGGLH